jgi:hypothetical protein
MKKRVSGLALAAAVALASCASVSDAPTGRYSVGSVYSVSLGREWADVSGLIGVRLPGVRILTIDGPLLNRLYLSEGLAAGASLVVSAEKEKPAPVYRADFSPQDTVEFVADSVTALGYVEVRTDNLRPGRFGDADAVRFHVSGRTKDGLDISGEALTAQKGGKLYLILYLAPAEHYFGDALPEVNSIMGSVAFGHA